MHILGIGDVAFVSRAEYIPRCVNMQSVNYINRYAIITCMQGYAL